MRLRPFTLVFLIPFLFATPASAQVSRNVALVSHPPAGWAEYAACWSYVHADGREYAAIGTDVGTAFYRLTDPANPVLVGHIAGPASQWREMKQYRNWMYIVSEGGGVGAGLQIVRMTNPDAPVLVATYTTTFITAHTVTIDTTRALLYANGARNATGMHVLSLANPEAPVEVGAYTGPYVHDSHIRDQRLYTSHINEGWVRVLDVSNPALINDPGKVLAAKTFSNPFPHNSWTSPDHNYLYVTNENNEGLMKTFDIRDLSNIVQTSSYRAREGAICHNVHNRGDTLFASHYTEGVRVLDIADPARPAEWGYYDTYLDTGTGFFGNWEVCAEYPSGIFIVSDMQSGLWVFRMQPNYGIVAGKVIDDTGALVSGATVTQTSGNAGGSLSAMEATSDAIGLFRVALDPGAYSYEAAKFGYVSGSAGGTLVSGATDSITIVLPRIPYADVTGVVTAAGASAFAPAGSVLEEADLHVDDTPLEAESDGAGSYHVDGLPEGLWTLHVSHPAYIPIERWIGIVGGANEVQDFALEPVAIFDPCAVQGTWTTFTTGDNATTVGRWAHGDPNGTGPQAAVPAPLAARDRAPVTLAARGIGDPDPVVDHPDHGSEEAAGPGPVAPEDDHTPGVDVKCFVTGLGLPGAAIGDHDVDTGKTTLTSPSFNLSGLADPVVAFAEWYVNDGNGVVDDQLVIQISNNGGTSWTQLDAVATGRGAWRRREFRVADFVPPTTAVRLRWIAADLGAGSVVEAGVDDLAFYDATDVVAVDPLPGRVTGLSFLAAAPNPSTASVQMTFAAPVGARIVTTIFDVKGRFVRGLDPAIAADGRAAMTWDGCDASGVRMPAGVYLVRATTGTSAINARLVRIP